MIAQGKWHVAEGREYIANAKGRWHPKGTSQLYRNFKSDSSSTHDTQTHPHRHTHKKAHQQQYRRTPHRKLTTSHYIFQMLKPLPNILAITGGVSSRQKEGKEKTQIETRQQYGTLSHDSLTASMFGNAQTCYFLPRKQAPTRDG